MTIKKSILVADDSPSIRRRLCELLTEKGFNVIEAKDGIEAIKKAFKFQPAFIVLDVNMPIISGYQACRFLKFRKESFEIPVMILTALDKPMDMLRGYETGADYYRSKSLSFEKIVEEITQEAEKINLPPRKSIEITETDILASINDYLDDKLFQLTLISEITTLSYRIGDLDEIVKECVIFLEKLLEFYSVSFALLDDEELNVYIFSRYEYGNYIEDIKAHIEQIFPKSSLRNIQYTTSCGVNPLPSDFFEKRDMVFVDSNLMESNHSSSQKFVSGGIFFCYNRDQVKEIEKIRFLINHILLVINNCLLYQRVVDLSNIDDLTKLFNRRKIMQILKTELERSMRYGFNLSVLIADIDFFKRINDKYGHKVGDLALKRVSNILKSSVRKVDYVGRFGGEEFLIVSPQTTAENARILAERIRTMVQSITIEGVEEKITISFGITSFANNKSIDELIHEADLALYHSKNTGRNKITIFGEER